MFDELVPGFEAILAAGHMGVVVQLVESCIHREERQASMLQHLLEVKPNYCVTLKTIYMFIFYYLYILYF